MGTIRGKVRYVEFPDKPEYSQDLRGQGFNIFHNTDTNKYEIVDGRELSGDDLVFVKKVLYQPSELSPGLLALVLG